MARFIQSLDTVRFVSVQDQDILQERLIQAQLDVLLSMLFGEPIHLPEPQSFDSLAFLEIANQMLDSEIARELLAFQSVRHRPGMKPITGSNSPVRNPFVLSIRRGRGYKDYRHMASFLLQQGINLKLSAWPEISDSPRERMRLASRIGKGEFAPARKDFPYLRERIDSIQQLDEYFRVAKHVLRRADSPSITLEKYVESIPTVHPNQLGHEWALHLEKLQAALHKLPPTVHFKSRTPVEDHGREYLYPDEYQMIVEYVNAAYNRVVADSIAATTRIFSTTGPGDDLAVAVSQFLPDEVVQPEVVEPIIEPDDGPRVLVLDLDSTAASKSGGSLTRLVRGDNGQSIWSDVWKIVTADEWIKTANELQAALKSGSSTRVDEALHSHITLLAGELTPFVFRYDNGGIKVMADMGHVGAPLVTVLEATYGVPHFALWLTLTSTASAIAPARRWWTQGSIWNTLYNSTRLRETKARAATDNYRLLRDE